MCITLVVQESHPSFETCEFVETVPRQETVVERGTVVTIVAGTLPCEESQRTGTEAGTDEGTEAAPEATPEAAPSDPAGPGGTDEPGSS